MEKHGIENKHKVQITINIRKFPYMSWNQCREMSSSLISVKVFVKHWYWNEVALYHISNIYGTWLVEEDQTTTRGGDHQNIQIELDRAFAGESKSNITKQALAWNPQGQRKKGIWKVKIIWHIILTLDLKIKHNKTLEKQTLLNNTKEDGKPM